MTTMDATASSFAGILGTVAKGTPIRFTRQAVESLDIIGCAS
jgi:hypothetical protein